MTIRKKLRDAAEIQIMDMVEKLEQRAIEICGETPVQPQELARLVASGKNTKTLMNKLQTKIADEAENEIVRQLEPVKNHDPGEML